MIMEEITPVPEPRSSDAQSRSFPVHPEKAQASTNALKIKTLQGNPPRKSCSAHGAQYEEETGNRVKLGRSSLRPGEQTNTVGTKKGAGRGRFDSGPVTAGNN